LQTEIATVSRAFEHHAFLRYEDFVADPSGTVARVVAELGLVLEDGALERIGPHEVDLPESHGLAGNPSRFQVGSVSLRADEAWRRGLGAREQRIVTAATAPLLLRYHYPLVSRRAHGPARPSGADGQQGTRRPIRDIP
jgi:hypothetical protein